MIIHPYIVVFFLMGLLENINNICNFPFFIFVSKLKFNLWKLKAWVFFSKRFTYITKTCFVAWRSLTTKNVNTCELFKFLLNLSTLVINETNSSNWDFKEMLLSLSRLVEIYSLSLASFSSISNQLIYSSTLISL